MKAYVVTEPRELKHLIVFADSPGEAQELFLKCELGKHTYFPFLKTKRYSVADRFIGKSKGVLDMDTNAKAYRILQWSQWDLPMCDRCCLNEHPTLPESKLYEDEYGNVECFECLNMKELK